MRVLRATSNAVQALSLAGAPVWSCPHPELSFSSLAAHHASRPFIDIMHLRLRVVAQALNAGYNVLLSDADAVFISPVTFQRMCRVAPKLQCPPRLHSNRRWRICSSCFAGFASGARGDVPKRGVGGGI